jgi:hypothetical protein
MKAHTIALSALMVALLVPFAAEAHDYADPSAQLYSPDVRELGVGLGLRANVDYSGGHELGLYGAGAVIRFVPSSRFALELTIDGAGSEAGYAVPIGLSGLFFFNRDSHFQPYLLAGVNMNILETPESLTAVYVGGHVGAGIELLVGSRVGLTLDGRAFIQGVAVKEDTAEIDFGVGVHTGFNIYL